MRVPLVSWVHAAVAWIACTCSVQPRRLGLFGIVIVRLPIPLAGIGAGSNTKVAGSNQSVPKGVSVRCRAADSANMATPGVPRL